MSQGPYICKKCLFKPESPWWRPMGKEGWGRWLIAKALDRSGRYCWAELVQWAYFSDDPRLPLRWRDHFKTDECRETAAKTGECYCYRFKRGEGGVTDDRPSA